MVENWDQMENLDAIQISKIKCNLEPVLKEHHEIVIESKVVIFLQSFDPKYQQEVLILLMLFWSPLDLQISLNAHFSITEMKCDSVCLKFGCVSDKF